MYQHILLATELDDNATEIEAKASEIQKLTQAQLTVIHIIESLPSAYAIGEIGVGYDFLESDETFVENTKKKLEPLAKRLKVPESNIVIRTGHVPSEILDYAANNQIDLIITGSHGRHGLKLLLGSTANALLHRAQCDVLSVRIQE